MSRRRKKRLGRGARIRKQAEMLLEAALASDSFQGDFVELADKLGWNCGTFWRENPAIKLAAKKWVDLHNQVNERNDMPTLGDELPKEIARVRDVLIPAYLECGVGGLPAVAMMRADLDRASKAMIEGDVVEMLRVYESLRSWQL